MKDYWTEFHEILKIGLMEKTFSINILPTDCQFFSVGSENLEENQDNVLELINSFLKFSLFVFNIILNITPCILLKSL